MNTNPVAETITQMVDADNETDRCLAIGELLERLVLSTGLRQDKLGPLAAALLLLWRVDHNMVFLDEHIALRHAENRARNALRRGHFSVDELSKLATCGRLLLSMALELQGEQLVAAPENATYVPQEGDLAVWLGKHIVRVLEVDMNEVHDGTGRIGSIITVKVKTAGGQLLPLSPAELELYHRDSEAAEEPVSG